MAPSRRWESEDIDPSPLGQPLKMPFSGAVFPNRFLKAAMTERISSWDPKDFETRGIPSKELINLYKRWGEGNIGQILTGNILIDPEHIEAPGNPIIPRTAPFHGERFEAFKEMATVGKKHGSLMVGQVNHPGRQTGEHLQKHPISASAVQLEGVKQGQTFGKPRAATDEDITNIKAGFVHAAEYLEKTGYDGIQLHAAHGYLLAQFISPTTNRRTDQYGGNLENRARLITEIAQEIREKTRPDFVLGIKLNSVEFQDKGLQPEEAAQLCALLETHKFDYVEISGGTYEKLAFKHERESTVKREAYFIEFADLIKPRLKQTKLYVTGGFKTVGAMVKALDTVDGIGLGRAITQEPRLCRDILDGKVKGAILQQVDPDDIGAGLVAAGTHIGQIGKDLEPIDLSQDENFKAFQKDSAKWVDIMAKDSEVRHQGYVDIKSAKLLPYGTVAA